MKAELDNLLELMANLPNEVVDDGGEFGPRTVVHELAGYHRGFRWWWLENGAKLTGPADVLATLAHMAHPDGPVHPVHYGLDRRAISKVRAKLAKLGVRSDEAAPVAQVATKPAAPKKAGVQIESQPAQVDAPGRGYATADEVELALGQLETMLDDEQLNRMKQPEIIRALVEIGVNTTDRTLRETMWWNCRQDRRAAGKQRANGRAKVT